MINEIVLYNKTTITEDFPRKLCLLRMEKNTNKGKITKIRNVTDWNRQLRSKTTMNSGVVIITFKFTSMFFHIFMGVFQHKENFLFY